MSVFGVIERVISASKGGFQIAQHRVDPAKLGSFDRLRASAHDVALVRGLGNGCDRLEAPQSVRDDVRTGCQRKSGPIGTRGFSEACHRRQAHQMRLARKIGLHCRHKRNFVRGCAPRLLAHPFTSQISVIDFYPVGEAARRLAHEHRLHQLVPYKPRRFVAHAELSHQLQARHRVLALRHQVDAQEPLRKAQLGVLEDGADNGGALIATVQALPDLTAVEAHRIALAAATRADKAFGPARRDQVALAQLIGTVALQEFSQRQAMLKLNTIHLHMKPQSV